MGDVIPLGGVTKLDIPADRVLDEAKGKLDKVIIVGIDKEDYHYFASSVADGGSALWLLECCKKALLSGV